MSSLFSKLRKEAKEKSKKTRGLEDKSEASMHPATVGEVEPSTPEELAMLEAALVEPESNKQINVSGHAKEIAIARMEALNNKGKNMCEAMGVYLDKSTGKFMKVLINYNPTTGESNIGSIEILSDSQAVATMKVGQYYSLKIVREENSI